MSRFPKAFTGKDSLDFSFSGLKTAVARKVAELDAVVACGQVGKRVEAIGSGNPSGGAGNGEAGGGGVGVQIDGDAGDPGFAQPGVHQSGFAGNRLPRR